MFFLVVIGGLILKQRELVNELARALNGVLLWALVCSLTDFYCQYIQGQFSLPLFLVFTWHHGGHVSVHNNSEKSLLGIWFYYYTKHERHFAIVMCTNIAVSSREWKPRIAFYPPLYVGCFIQQLYVCVEIYPPLHVCVTTYPPIHVCRTIYPLTYVCWSVGTSMYGARFIHYENLSTAK